MVEAPLRCCSWYVLEQLYSSANAATGLTPFSPDLVPDPAPRRGVDVAKPGNRKEGEEEDTVLMGSTAEFDIHSARNSTAVRGLTTDVAGKAKREGEEEDLMMMDTFDPLSHPR